LSRARRRLCAAGLVVALGWTGCAGEDERDGSARDGGSIAVGAETVPTTLDPALADDVRELQVLRLVHTPLLTYPHEGGKEGVEPVPGLARARPRVSYDGLTYTLRLRSGLRYSNGVPVRAGDFERAIERVRALGSPLAPLYAGIVSIDADARTGLIRLKLRRSDPALLQVLALPSSAPLPRGTPVRDLSRRPPAGAGAYRIERTRRRDRVVLTRWHSAVAPDGTDGHADRIAIVRAGPPAAQSRAVLAGTLDVMQTTPEPVGLLPELRSVRKDRYREEITTATVALVPDTEAPPLYDPGVRRAIAQALDPATLTRLYRGQLEPSCNVLPPVVDGFRTLDPCPYGDRSEPADLPAAREAIEEAAPAVASVSVESADGVPAPVVRYVASTLRKIGLVASVGGRGARLRVERIAPLAAHPAAYLERFHSARDLALSNELTRAARAISREDAADAWAAADERVVTEAFAAPLGYERAPVLLAERMDTDNCEVVHPVFGLDLATLCLR